MANLKFSYRYKDFTNYRKVNEVIFLNPTNKPVSEVQKIIKNYLIDSKWFYATEWEVPDLHFDNWDSEADHFLHEFLSIEETMEHSYNHITIDDFIEIVKEANIHF
jgi:hypothetical protein